MVRQKRKNYQDNCKKLAFWRKLRGTLQRSYTLTFFGFVLIFSMFAIWLYKDDDSQTLTEVIADNFYELLAEGGFKLELVTFEGDKYIGQAQLVEELELFDGTPIFALDLEELRKEIKTRNWVKDAQIRRELPSKLKIKISERQPLAVWQFQRKLYLIDEDGVVLTDLDGAEGLPFPLIVGEGANTKASQIFALLKKEKTLYSRVHAAIRLNDRRWNVSFMNGIEVMLPEENLEEAWKKLARLQMEKQVLDREVKAIDLRMPDRIYIRTVDGKNLLNASGRSSL